MRKRYVSDDELNQIIKLKKAGASWSRIEEKMGVPRRTAKKAYDEWEKNLSINELKAARINVASEMFKEHINSMIKVAENIRYNIDMPNTVKERRNAKEFIDSIWILETIKEDTVFELPQHARKRKVDYRIIQNKMILSSLKEHTLGQIKWEILKEWEKAWDSTIGIFESLEDKYQKVAGELIINDAELEQVVQNKKWGNAAQGTTQMALQAIWEEIIKNKSIPELSKIKVGYPLVDRMITIRADKPLIDKFVAFCNEITAIIIRAEKNKSLARLSDHFKEMKKSITTLSEELNPIVILPILIRTRCELCPA